MANVKLPSNQYVDLYSASGITPGTQIQVLNITPNDVRLYDVASPTPASDHIPVLFNGSVAQNDSGDLNAVALCVAGGAVDVRAV